jgi:Cytotoxic translational repressor of toxin-antitoxin stability system
LYDISVKKKLSKELRRLDKKNPVLYNAFYKKAAEICANPKHYKNLNAPYSKYRRVHINSNFVLCYYIDEEAQKVVFVKLAPHDEAYKS